MVFSARTTVNLQTQPTPTPSPVLILFWDHAQEFLFLDKKHRETHYSCIITEYENRNTTHATVLFLIGCINFYKECRAGEKVPETGHGPYPSRGNTSQILKPFTGSTNVLLCWYHRKQEWFHCLGGIMYSLQAVL